MIALGENLSPLRGDCHSFKIAGFDVETVQTPMWLNWNGGKQPGKKQEFYLGSLVWDDESGNERVETWFDKEEMADLLTGPQFRGFKIFATNLAFDLTEIFYPFKKNWELLFNGSQLIVAIYHQNERNTIRFFDTTNINRYMSVAQMGDFLGFEKLDKPERLGQLPQTKDELDYLKRYNIRDAQITKRYIQYFQKVINQLGGTMQATAPSTSMDLWRRKYLDRHIRQPWKWVCQGMYDGMFGGRTEVFVKGFSKDLRYYDVNSLYPYVMNTIQFPDTDTLHDWTDGTFDKNLLLNEGMTWCKVRAPTDLHIPILPLKKQVGEQTKLLFPVGEFWGCWPHNELRYAVLNGYEITDWKRTLWTEKSFNPFESYIQDLYALRLKWKKEGNKAQEVVKLMMNSLFGKFGQRIDGKGGTYKTLDSVSDLVQLDDKEVCGDFVIEPKDFFPVYVIPIFAAYITAGARMHLHRLMNSVGLDNVVYCDTDSIVTTGYFDTNDKLGGLKLELNIEKGWFFKPKFYRVIGTDAKGQPQDMAHCKGIPNSRMDFFFDNGFHSMDFRLTMDKMLKFREAVRRGMKPNTILNEFTKAVSLDVQNDKRIFVGGDVDLLSENQKSVPIFIDPQIYISASG